VGVQRVRCDGSSTEAEGEHTFFYGKGMRIIRNKKREHLKDRINKLTTNSRNKSIKKPV
jgi:hypothetical protein